ncbi:MAG TPA: HRDC domain-containing protein, partial [Vicinamibacteria bacterium]|nr:HRDC domain-containing protein [Vicinamibacteria bacterium]
HDPQAYLSIKGARRLAPRALLALRELVAWRERRAEQTDTPAFKIAGNELLLQLAEQRPRELRGFHGLPPRLQRRERELLEALRRADALPDQALPPLPRPPRPATSDEALQRVQRLRAWRAAKAAELEVDVSVVLPQRLIDRLAEAAPRDLTGLLALDGLRRWRVEAFGRELLAAL